MFWRQFWATARLHTLCPPFFYTSFRSHCENIYQGVVFFTFLTEDAFFFKFVVAHTDQTSQFRQIFSCAICFAQFLASLHMAPISSKTTVVQSVSTPIWSKTTFAHGVLHKLNRKRHFEVVRTFWTFLQFRTTGQWRTVFGTGLSLLTIRDSCDGLLRKV